MSPSCRHLNAARPAPLKIHKDSHLIQKTTSSSSITTTTSSSSTGTATNNNSNSNTKNNNSSSSSSSNYHHLPPRQQPVIIYTHSPKIIHTHARDFMALVQKLTGLDSTSAASSTSTSSSVPRPPQAQAQAQPPSTCSFKGNGNNSSSLVATPTHDDSASSSENCMVNNAEAAYVGCSSLSSTIMPSCLGFDHQMPPPPFMSDVPFFMPGHSDLFCSPTAFYRYPDSAMFSPQIPNMDEPFSPSVMEAMRTLSDY